ncbi:MAG: hydroxyacid dehydrogenase [Oscillospiraceae bacterium]|nr:hydroxyacid dehydrogenase [Oscillospiraceae bacterium]
MRPTAVYMTDTNSVTFHDVYPDSTMEKIRELCDIPDGVITSANLEEHRALLAETEYIFSTWGMLSLTEEQIADYLPRLKAVFYAAGSVQYFARPFLNKGIRVFSAWAANAVPVAEYTIAQIILSGKGMFRDMRMMREAKEKHAARAAAAAYTHTLPCNYGVKVGLLGAGMIGRLVMKMLMDYDFEVLVYDPFVDDGVLAQYGARRASLEEIFSECQIISNHIANLPTTVGMLDYALFSRMKDNAVFINTGRGAQVVEDDLIRALREKPDRTALLDVTWPEPPAEDSPLWELDNVFLTPHIAGSLKNETARMSAYMEEECRKFLAGEPCSYEVSMKMLETMA